MRYPNGQTSAHEWLATKPNIGQCMSLKGAPRETRGGVSSHGGGLAFAGEVGRGRAMPIDEAVPKSMSLRPWAAFPLLSLFESLLAPPTLFLATTTTYSTQHLRLWRWCQGRPLSISASCEASCCCKARHVFQLIQIGGVICGPIRIELKNFFFQRFFFCFLVASSRRRRDRSMFGVPRAAKLQNIEYGASPQAARYTVLSLVCSSAVGSMICILLCNSYSVVDSLVEYVRT